MIVAALRVGAAGATIVNGTVAIMWIDHNASRRVAPTTTHGCHIATLRGVIRWRVVSAVTAAIPVRT